MGSKSKRRHAQKQYNRAQNKPATEVVNEAVVNNNGDVTADATAKNGSEPTAVIMTPKELRQAEKARAKQEKLMRKQQAKNASEKAKDKKEKKNQEKKPFFLIRFFRWIASIFSELKKVHWPTFKQVIKATGIVLGIVVLFGLVLLVIWILFGLLHYLLINGSLSGWTVF